MNTTIPTDIRKLAKKGLDKASDSTVRMVLAILEIDEQGKQAEKEIETEMNRRIAAYESGNTETYTFEEIEPYCLKAIANK
jgi:hypothetical protein